ncbi:MAG: site-specific integrase [Muribaculaceae bacterium]|nr:site-specific integrase [Muribaculaceae bacterium]
MASIKVKFRPSTVADIEGTIYYQIIHERKVRQLLSDYKVFPSEWDESRSMVTTTHKSERKSFILSIRERIRWDVERLTKIIRKLHANGLIYTADDVIDEFNRYAHEYSLFNFMESIIAKLKQNGKVRTSETYKSTLNSFKKFRMGEDIMLDSLTSEIMEAYEAWLHTRGVAPNTISFYTRILRAVYNRAVEDDVIENRNPFRHVYTGVDKTVKRALPLVLIKKIKALDLFLTPSLDFARDMFLMSFYLRGMSFIDMAFLRKSDLKNGYVSYRRRKTGQQLIIEWTKEMQMILNKYPENSTDYLLPIIKNPGTNERCTYRNAGYNINHNLKKIAGKVGVTIPLTLYVARHSWASAAKAKGIPLSVISEGMGHDSEATTQIYLASLDTSVVDRANSLILSSL